MERLPRIVFATFLASAVSLVAPASAVDWARGPRQSAFEVVQRANDVFVRGYRRRDGTYVRPHWRSAPDGVPENNFGFPGNRNPYTGKVAAGGGRNPDLCDDGHHGDLPPHR